MGIVATDTSCYENIANLIRERAGTEIGYTPEEMPDAIREAWDAAMYNIVLDGGKRSSAEYTFARWQCEYIRPPFVWKPTTRTISCFQNNSKLKKIEKQYFDFSGCPISYGTGSSGHYYICAYCYNLEVFEDIGLPPSGYAFTWTSCIKLHTIELVRSHKQTQYDSAFWQCDELVNIRFEGEIGQRFSIISCGKLSDDSINDIIDHLADLTGETAKTITFHSNITTKLTTEQVTRITNKNWTLG